jgi:hypothetical protein
VFAAHVPATDNGHTLEVVRGAAGAEVVRGTPLLAANPIEPLGCNTVPIHIDTRGCLLPMSQPLMMVTPLKWSEVQQVQWWSEAHPCLLLIRLHPLVAILCQHT